MRTIKKLKFETPAASLTVTRTLRYFHISNMKHRRDQPQRRQEYVRARLLVFQQI